MNYNVKHVNTTAALPGWRAIGEMGNGRPWVEPIAAWRTVVTTTQTGDDCVVTEALIVDGDGVLVEAQSWSGFLSINYCPSCVHDPEHAEVHMLLT